MGFTVSQGKRSAGKQNDLKDKRLACYTEKKTHGCGQFCEVFVTCKQSVANGGNNCVCVRVWFFVWQLRFSLLYTNDYEIRFRCRYATGEKLGMLRNIAGAENVHVRKERIVIAVLMLD